MKIYRSIVREPFRPDHQGFVWPPHNNDYPPFDWGVEQDFDRWLLAHPELLTDNPAEADWNYVPIYLNRYFINTLDSDRHWGGGVPELAAEVARARITGMRAFTISEGDVYHLYRDIDWGDLTIFIASRRGERGIDIPLLSALHPIPDVLPAKRWLASFIGHTGTDGIRIQMREALEGRSDCYVKHGNDGPKVFEQTMLESYIALCPRGQGGQSFRFWEAMQMGVMPLYLSDIDCRPFQGRMPWFDSMIPWDTCSLWMRSVDECVAFLDNRHPIFECNKDTLLSMGRKAKDIFDNQLGWGKWCEYVIKELELL